MASGHYITSAWLSCYFCHNEAGYQPKRTLHLPLVFMMAELFYSCVFDYTAYLCALNHFCLWLYECTFVSVSAWVCDCVCVHTYVCAWVCMFLGSPLLFMCDVVLWALIHSTTLTSIGMITQAAHVHVVESLGGDDVMECVAIKKKESYSTPARWQKKCGAKQSNRITAQSLPHQGRESTRD